MDTEITQKTKEEETGGQMTFFEHLIELRKRIINSLIAIAVCAPLMRSSRPRNASGASDGASGTNVYLETSIASYIVCHRPPRAP